MHDKSRLTTRERIRRGIKLPRGTNGYTGEPPHDFSHYASQDHHVFTARDFLSILFKRRKVMMTFVAVVVAIVVVRLVTSPPLYEVTAAILVKKPVVAVPMTPEGTRPSVTNVTTEDLNSEIEILKNRRLIEQVAQDVTGPASGPSSLIARGKSAVEAMVGVRHLSALDNRILEISENLDFGVVEGSHVLELGFVTPDPEWGTSVLHALIDRYIDFRLEVHQAPQSLTFFDERTGEALDRLTTAETALDDYRQQTGVSAALSDQMILALQKVDQFERQASETSVALEQQRQRVENLEARLAGEPERRPSSSREHMNAEIEQLSVSLVDLRLRRDDLRTRGFADTSVRIRDIQAQIDLAERRLEAAKERIGINQTEVNPIHEQLQADLVRGETELNGLEARLAALRAEVLNARAAVNELNEQSLPIRRLDREASSAEESYMMLRRIYEETRITQAMGQQAAIDVSVARDPMRPLLPMGLSTTAVLIITLCFSVAGALAIAFVLEHFDHSITTAEELEDQLGLAVLGSIPEWDQRHGSMLPAGQYRID